MRTLASVLLCVFLHANVVLAQEKNAIRLPATAMPVIPSPTTELLLDSVFVVESDTPCLVLASRVGFVDVTKEEGPLRIRGRFADGPSKVESRTYKGKHLWIVEATNVGEVELLIIPGDTQDVSAVIRRMLLIKDTKSTPLPPTKPTPTPQPPTPPPGQPTPQPEELTFGLIKVVKDSVQKNIPANKQILVLDLAKAYKEGAESLAKGIWAPENAISNQRNINQAIAGYDAVLWNPVFVDIANCLGTARSNGKLQTAKQWTAAYAELSIAFFQSYVGTVQQ